MNRDTPLSTQELLEHQGWLRALSRRLVEDEAQADDLVQQTWMAALRSSPKPGTGIRGWLATVARRAASNVRRERSRRDRRERGSAEKERVDDPTLILDEIEAQRSVVDAVLRLDEPYRTAVILRYFRDRTPTEIAEQLGEKVSTIKTRLRRALVKLRERMDEDHGGARRDWCLALVPVAAQAPAIGSVWTVGGGLVMKSLGKLIAAFVLIAVTAGVVWTLLTDDPASVATPAVPGLLESQAPSVPDPIRAERATAPEVRRSSLGEASAGSSGGNQGRGSGKAELWVRDDDGFPAAAAQVVLVRKGSVPIHIVLGEQGGFLFEADARPAEAFVFWNGAPPYRQSILLNEGNHVLTLPRGAVVAGRVTMDGAAPPRPVSLVLTSPGPFGSAASFPSTVKALMKDWGVGPSELSRVTEPDGSFHFHGLPADFAGQFLLPQDEYTRLRPLAEDTRWIDVPYPRMDYLLALGRRPSIFGRVVDSNGLPAVGGSVRAEVLRAGRSFVSRVELEAAGEFEVFLGDETATRVALTFSDASGAGRYEMALDSALTGRRDLGEVRLDAVRRVRFRVADLAGDPIVGAQARSVSVSRPGSVLTDASGSGSYEVSEEESALLFLAPGYEVGEAPVPQSLDVTLTVRLTAATSLNVVLVDDRGDPATELTLRVEADRAFLTDPGGYQKYKDEPVGFNPDTIGGSWGMGRAMTLSARVEDGRVLFSRVQAGLPLRLAAIDYVGSELASAEVTLRDGEQRSVTLVVPRLGGKFEGRVLDPAGLPLEAASVFVSVDGVRNDAVSTDSEGRFVAPRVRADRVRVMVRRRYYVSQVFDLDISRDGTARDVMLEPATDIECYVRDQHGRPMDGAEVSVSSNDEIRKRMGMHFVCHADSEGWARLDDLPLGLVTLRVSILGQSFEFPHDTLVARANLVVPAHGQVEVHYGSAFHEPLSDHRIRYRPLDGGPDVLDGSVVVDPSVSSIRHTTGAILPGRYRVTLERLSEEDWETFVPVASAIDVRVDGRGVTQVALVSMGG